MMEQDCSSIFAYTGNCLQIFVMHIQAILLLNHEVYSLGRLVYLFGQEQYDCFVCGTNKGIFCGVQSILTFVLLLFELLKQAYQFVQGWIFRRLERREFV